MSDQSEIMLSLSDLQRLADADQQKDRLVELKHFGGLSVEETTEVPGGGTAAVNRSRMVKTRIYRGGFFSNWIKKVPAGGFA